MGRGERDGRIEMDEKIERERGREVILGCFFGPRL